MSSYLKVIDVVRMLEYIDPGKKYLHSTFKVAFPWMEWNE